MQADWSGLALSGLCVRMNEMVVFLSCSPVARAYATMLVLNDE